MQLCLDGFGRFAVALLPKSQQSQELQLCVMS